MTLTRIGPPRLQRLMESGGVIAIAVVVMNLGTYGFQMIAARLVGPSAYGSIASLLAFQFVFSVLALGLQTTAARRIASAPDDLADVEHGILTLGWRSSTVLALALLVASPLIEHLLQLQSVYPAILLAIGTLPMNLMGAQAGILQGERRWNALATVYLAAGLPRLFIGAIALAIRPTEGAAMAAVALGWIAPCLVGWWCLHRGRNARARGTGRPIALRALTQEVAHAAFALLAFFALSNVDILMSRHILSPEESGLYAGGLILTKAVLFLPQFVSIIAFPAMSTPSQRRSAMLRALAMVGLVGAVCVLGAVVFDDLAMIFVGGSEYESIKPYLWQFALLGMLLSGLQLLVYSVLARQSHRSSWLLWSAVVVAIVVGWWGVSTMPELLNLMTLTDAVLFALLLGLSLWTMRADKTADPEFGSVGGVVPAAPEADAHVQRDA